MPEDISWDEYNAHQAGRAPRDLLVLALGLRAATDAGPVDAPPPVAIDLGCGEGVEVEALLAAGWSVHALDGEPAALARLADRVAASARERLHLHHRTFGEIAGLPQADLVHSSYALPYCPPQEFDALWREVRAALAPGGLLALQLFGVRDSMARDPDMTFHDLEQVHGMLDGLEVLHWREEDAPGTSFTGPKHWHVFHVVARRPVATPDA